MADNHFEMVLIYSNLGGTLRLSPHGRAVITDPVTSALVPVVQDGQTVTTVVANEAGAASFVAQQGIVTVTSGGLSRQVVSAEQITSGASSAALAQTAQAAAESARDDAETAATNAAATVATKVDKGVLVVNVRDHGATGDGTTDDTTAVQAALDEAASSFAHGYLVGQVLLPGGTYVVSHIEVGTGVTLRGQGGAVLKHKAAASSACAQTPSTVVGASIVGVEIDGNAANQTQLVQGIRVDAERTHVSDCYVHDTAYDGIIVNGAAARWVTVTGNRVKTTGRYGITIGANTSADAPENVVIGFNHVEASTDGALGIVGVGRHITFVGNTTRDHGGDGIAAYNAANEDITCTGNTFHNPGNHGIHLGGRRLAMVGNTAHGVVDGHGYFIHNHDLSTAYSATITGNAVYSTAAGEGIRTEFCVGVAISGNTINSAFRHGIYPLSCTEVAITGNTVNTTSTGRGMQIESCTNVAVTGNVVTNPFLQAIIGAGSSTAVVVSSNVLTGGQYAVQTTGTCTDWRVADNTMNGQTTGKISLVGGSSANWQQPSNRVIENTAPPGSGTWAVGDVVRNTAPTAGGGASPFMGWVCTVGGTPGTWKSFGAISA